MIRMLMNRTRLTVAAGFLLLAANYPVPAHADCTGPAGTEGVMVYDNAHNTMVFCDGTDWISMSGGGGSGISDSDKGDVTVSGSGATWTIDSGAVTPAKTDFVGTLTEGKWCSVSGGDIVCTSDAPGNSSGLGVDQTWQNMLGSRSSGTSYQNTTEKPIMVNIGGWPDSAQFQVSSDNSSWVSVHNFDTDGDANSASAIIPSNHYYRLTSGAASVWSELR